MNVLCYTGKVFGPNITEIFAEEISGMITSDEKVVYIDADLMSSIGTRDIWTKDKTGRIINCGVQEANMVGVGAGMSAIGMKPWLHSFATFATRRTFDQTFISVAYAGKNAHIVGSDAGVCAAFNGGTHMAFEDMALMRAIPGSVVADITDGTMLKKLMHLTKDMPGLFYFRLQRKNIVPVYDEKSDFDIGKGEKLREGTDCTIVASGIMVAVALEASEELSKRGVSVDIIDPVTVKPLDSDLIIESVKKTGCIITAENHNAIGGLGSAVSEVLSERYPVPMARIGVHEEFGRVGTEDELRKHYGFTPNIIVEKVIELISKKKERKQ